MEGPRHPDHRWFRWAVLGAILVGIAVAIPFYFWIVRSFRFTSLDEGVRTQLAALKMDHDATSVIERRWVAEGFGTGYLQAPVGPMACPPAAASSPPHERSAAQQAFVALEETDPDGRIERLAPISDANPSNLLVALIYGTALVKADRMAEGEQIIGRALGQTNEDESIIDAAKRPGTPLDLGNDRVATVIYLHHALGVAGLSQSGSTPPWRPLKNVIGSVRHLSRKSLIGSSRDPAVSGKLLIPAPGCGAGVDALSSYDLFNNLIVGYVRGKFVGNESERQKEFYRDRKTYPSAVHRLLLLQRDRAGTEWKDESALWALSNAEQVLDLRTPDDARLNFNIIQLLDWWTADERCRTCPAEILQGVHTMKGVLLQNAIRRHNVPQEQQAEFARGITRMLADSNIERARLEADAETIRGWLSNPRQAQTLADLFVADRARAAFPGWVVQPEQAEEPPYEKLGTRADAWRAAAQSDFAAAVAKWSSERPAVEKKQTLIAIRQMLGWTKAPDEVKAVEKSFGWGSRLSIFLAASHLFWALVAAVLGLIVWTAIVTVLVQVHERRSLHTSFYNIEFDYLRSTDRTSHSGRPRP